MTITDYTVPVTVDGENASVTFDIYDGFRMDCSCRVGMWCPHREAVVNQRKEAELLRIPFEDGDTFVVAVVPIFPKERLFAPVILKEGRNSPGILHVTRQSELGEHIGVLDADEGLKAIRSLELAYFDMMRDDTKQCNMAFHTYNAQRRIDMALSKQETIFLMKNSYSLFLNGHCILCHTSNRPGADNGLVQDDFDDLIPDAPERTRRPWDA